MKIKRKCDYLLYALRKEKVLTIVTSNQKKMQVKIIGIEDGKAKYKILNSTFEGKIKFENIVSVNLADKEEENLFLYEQLSKKYDTNNLKEIIENFKNYYLEMIDVLFVKEKKNSVGYYNLRTKKKEYPQIFEELLKDEDNLLFHYFIKKQVDIGKNQVHRKKEMLLIEQANLSQKQAIHQAMSERISIIEGPPGTGKTTTILNILANLIYQNKKVLVVSKNNSAIENIVEELNKMDIPKVYIRMRKFGYYAEGGRTEFRKKCKRIIRAISANYNKRKRARNFKFVANN